MSARQVLSLALLALAGLYALWFLRSGDPVAALVFALPPLLLAVAVRLRPRGAQFWAGVLALAWFAHGVMVAWSRPYERLPALAAMALALVVVFAANAEALRARFLRGRAR